MDNPDNEIAANKSIFILTVLERNQISKIKSFSRSVTYYKRWQIKPTNTKLKKLTSLAKIKTGAILRINKKKFQDKKLPLELFLTTRQTTKIRNSLANNRYVNRYKT